MSDLIISLTDIQRLKEELNTLNAEYITLYEKMEDLKKEKEYLESLYMCKLGSLIFLRLESEIRYRKLKKKLTLIIKSKNKGEEINVKKIEEVLEKELTEFYRGLEQLRDSLKNFREFLELPTLTKEEVKRVKEIFRSLAKILHPDVNKHLNEKMMELWLKVKEAYENNDLITLVILEGIVKNNEFKEDIKVTSIEENIDMLKIKIDELKKFIDKKEKDFSLNIKEVIDDSQYIENKKQEITTDIREYERMIVEVEKSISQLMEEKSYG